MDASLRATIPGVISALALGVTFGMMRLRRYLCGTRAPMEMRFLRSPGESLRKRLAQLNETSMYCTGLFALGPVVYAWVTPGFPDYLSMGLLLGVVGLCLIPVVMVTREYRACSLGLAGERVVGEELNQLMLEGCQVFHDYPGGAKWNIDHVVVAASGVYAIETKTRSKRRAPPGKKDQEVEFDGEKLRFPRFTTDKELEQARRNAVDLSRELSSATGEPVRVKAILTYPGWFVKRSGKSDVTVVNAKEIRQVILSGGEAQLSPSQIQRVVHQVQQKCRDVEI